MAASNSFSAHLDVIFAEFPAHGKSLAISVDTQAGVLTVGVHPMANPRSNRAIDHLLGELNASEITYPGTTLKLAYTLLGVSST